MWRTTEEKLDKNFERYYKVTYKRLKRRTKWTVDKNSLRTLFNAWVQLQKLNTKIQPTNLGLPDTSIPDTLLGVSDFLMFTHKKGKLYPTEQFLTYVEIECIDVAKTLEQYLEEVTDKVTLETSSVVYFILFSNGFKVGRTSRELRKRLSEHISPWTEQPQLVLAARTPEELLVDTEKNLKAFFNLSKTEFAEGLPSPLQIVELYETFRMQRVSLAESS